MIDGKGALLRRTALGSSEARPGCSGLWRHQDALDQALFHESPVNGDIRDQLRRNDPDLPEAPPDY